MTTIDQAQQSEDAVAKELLSAFVGAWTEVFDLPVKLPVVDTINENTALLVYYGDGQSSNARLMKEFFVKYDKLIEFVYDGNEFGLDLAVAWCGPLGPDSAPSANAIMLFHPDLQDRLTSYEVSEFWSELGFGMFVIVNTEERPMDRWHEAARSIMVSNPYRSVPGRKWFVISTNTEVSELLGDIPL